MGKKEDDGTILIIVQDDGVGIPESLDWKNTESLGMRLVDSLTGQLQGTIELDRTGGTKFTIVIKERDERQVNEPLHPAPTPVWRPEYQIIPAALFKIFILYGTNLITSTGKP